MRLLGDTPDHNPDLEELPSLFRELIKKFRKDGVSPRVAELRLSSAFRDFSLTLEIHEQRALLEHLLPHGGSPEQLMNVPEVAKFLGKSEDWVYDHKLDLGAVKAGRSIRFHKKEVDAYLHNHKGAYS